MCTYTECAVLLLFLVWVSSTIHTHFKWQKRSLKMAACILTFSIINVLKTKNLLIDPFFTDCKEEMEKLLIAESKQRKWLNLSQTLFCSTPRKQHNRNSWPEQCPSSIKHCCIIFGFILRFNDSMYLPNVSQASETSLTLSKMFFLKDLTHFWFCLVPNVFMNLNCFALFFVCLFHQHLQFFRKLCSCV